MLGAGHIMVQRYGDILDGKRTWQKELAQSNVKPTLKDAVAGDITAAMPYRAMTNIIEFIKMLDMVVPGFAANETLLYSPELKFYSNKVKMDENLDTNIQGLHCLGDDLFSGLGRNPRRSGAGQTLQVRPGVFTLSQHHKTPARKKCRVCRGKSPAPFPAAMPASGLCASVEQRRAFLGLPLSWLAVRYPGPSAQ